MLNFKNCNDLLTSLISYQAKLHFWDENTGPGHVALQIFRDNYPVIYISFRPEDSIRLRDLSVNTLKNLYSTNGNFISSYDHENEMYGNNTPNSYLLHNIDCMAMIKRCAEITGHSELFCRPLDFGLKPGNHTCTSLVFALLEAGGIRNLIPAYGRFGHPQHLLLLALRTPLAIAALSPLYYSLLIERAANSILVPTTIFSAYSANIIGIALFEKYVVANEKVLCIASRSIRQRKLIEISHADIIVQISATLGFGLFGMFLGPVPNGSTTLFNAIIADFPQWFFWSAIGFASAGMLASRLVYFAQGINTILRPNGLKTIAEYLMNTQNLDPTMRRCQFSKEYMLLFINLAHIIGDYIAKDTISNPEMAFIIGSCVSTIIGFLASSIAIKSIEYFQPINPLNAEQKQLLQSHNPKPGCYAYLGCATTLGIVGSVFLYEALTDSTNIMLMGAVSVVGGFLGYLGGLASFQAMGSGMDYIMKKGKNGLGAAVLFRSRPTDRLYQDGEVEMLPR